MDNINILIVGVGGQGTLLASRVLGEYAIQNGKDCKLSEVHGMAQRGGSVVTHVRMGEKIYSPIIAEGQADIILAFEKLEAARWRHYIKKDGVIVVNDAEIPPLPVITGAVKYPHDVIESAVIEGKKVIIVDAQKVALEAGNIKTVNTVMIGAMAKNLGFSYEKIEAAIQKVVPQKALEVNKKALRLGFDS